MSLVSAIIVTHNRARLLERAMESVLAQTYADMECIVVSDASTDETDAYCMARQDIRYIRIPKEESRGGNHARNVGILAARGEYVALLDDDDYWLPTKIEKQVALIEEKGCDLVYCGTHAKRLHADGTIEDEFWPMPEEAQGDLSTYVLSHIVVMTSQVLMRRQAVIDAGLFDEDLHFWQEYELTIRMAQRTPFYFVPERLMIYSLNPYDPARLTNRYRPWRKAVHYIHRKHRALYHRLSWREWIAGRQLYWYEGIKRATGAGKKWDARMYWLWIKLSRLDIIISRTLSKCKRY